MTPGREAGQRAGLNFRRRIELSALRDHTRSVEPRRSVALGDVRRIVAISACCLLAAISPLIVGVLPAVLGVIPLGLAVWLVTRSGWSSRTRVTSVLAVVLVTVALFIALLAVALRYANN